jgi:hypothetical protein
MANWTQPLGQYRCFGKERADASPANAWSLWARLRLIAPWLRAGWHFKHGVVRKEAHDAVEIMGVERIHEGFQRGAACRHCVFSPPSPAASTVIISIGDPLPQGWLPVAAQPARRSITLPAATGSCGSYEGWLHQATMREGADPSATSLIRLDLTFQPGFRICESTTPEMAGIVGDHKIGGAPCRR